MESIKLFTRIFASSNTKLKYATMKLASYYPVIFQPHAPENFQTHRPRFKHKFGGSNPIHRFMPLQIMGAIFLFLPSVVSRSCQTVPQPATLSYLHSLFTSGGRISLCPNFVISSDGCDTNGEPFIVSNRELDLTVKCDNVFGSHGHCKISCPGKHFEVESGTTLILEGMNLEGATSGSIEIKTGGSLIAFDSTWEGNSNMIEDGRGAAIYSNGTSSVSLANDTFCDNIAQGDGGALYITGSATIISCVLENNSALKGSGGAVFVTEKSSVSIRRSSFEGNSALEQGEAIFSESGAIYNAAENDGCGDMAFTSRNLPNIC